MDKINIDVISKFSHLLATEVENDNFEAVIIDTIYNSKKSLTNDTLVDEMQAIFCIAVDPMKVQRHLKKLCTNGKIYNEGRYVFLTPSTLDDITAVLSENEHIQNVALQTWIKTFSEMVNETISQEKADVISSTIVRYLSGFFLIHGANSFSLITRNKEYNSIDVKYLVEYSLREIPDEYKVQMKVFLEKIFTDELTSEQKKYCIKQINKAIAYLSTVADDQTVETVTEKVRGITIYLDTPILYRLLNLQGEGRYNVITSLINHCRENNIELKVFQKTIDELKRRIQYDANLIGKYEYPVSFASIGYKCRTSENYLSTFWKARKDTGISAKDFNYRYKDIANIIIDHNIIIDYENYAEKNNLTQHIDDLYCKVSAFSAKDPEYPKSSNSIEHDAVCLAYIEHLRCPNATTAFDSKVVFLTSDWSLVRLQKYDNDYQERPDLVILPSQLMQIFCMTQSNDKYYETFLGLFSSSKTTFGTNRLSNDCIQEILGRISYYKGATAEFAERILCSQLIQENFGEKESEAEQYQLIDDVMLSEVETMEKNLIVKDELLATAEAINNDKEGLIDNLNSRLERLEMINNDKDNEISNYIKYQMHFEKSIKTKARRKAIIRVAFGGIIILLAIIGIMVCVLALFPKSSGLVKPIFDYIRTAETINEDGASNLSIIELVFALISGGLLVFGKFIVGPGYNKLRKDYYKKYQDSIG